jgi:hypothetical protein
MELLNSNLNGAASGSDALRALPAVEVFSYQCSPLSTGRGIEAVFDKARTYKRAATNTVVVVLLDEVSSMLCCHLSSLAICYACNVSSNAL